MIARICISLFLFAAPAKAVKIVLDYTYDTNNFFAQTGSKTALRAVADFYEPILQDSLARIDQSQAAAGSTWSAVFSHPGTGQTVSVPNLIVPADTLIVYVGGRPLGGASGLGGPGGYSGTGFSAWFNLLDSRGETGALAIPATDFGPWGGSISFSTSSTWNFSTTQATSGQAFVSVALHEFGHLLGIGTSASWSAKISAGVFRGPTSVAAYGSNIPVVNGGAHWRDDGSCAFPYGHVPSNPNNVLSEAFGSFGAVHGFDQIALMDPVTCSAGSFFKVMTDLDLAALADIGWEAIPPARWIHTQLNPNAGPRTFTWASTTGLTYRAQSSPNLQTGSWTTFFTQAGNGDPQSASDSSAPGSIRFYRLVADRTANAARMAAPILVDARASAPFVLAPGCGVISGECCGK